MFKNYSFTRCVVEMRVSGAWHRMRETASRGEARLAARILAFEHPLLAVRIREEVQGA